MTNHRSHDLEPETKPKPLVLRVHVRGAVAIDILANARLRWLCRAGFTPTVHLVSAVA
jgi:hypothetical protein